MITHVVMMKFKPDVSDEQVTELEARFEALPDIIYEIQSYEFGRDLVRSERSFDFALVSVFANMETLRQEIRVLCTVFHATVILQEVPPEKIKRG